MARPLFPTCTHWGNYRIEVENGELKSIHPYAADPNPSPISQSLLQSRDPNYRIAEPMVRSAYLQNPTGHNGEGRGRDSFVAVSWDVATQLAAEALQRAKEGFGNESIYGGSYGWASAGRFHHAQSQVHRFLNFFGGYTRSENSYSTAAAEVIMPHVLGVPFAKLIYESPPSEDISQHTKTLLLFGGAALKNAQVNSGGLGSHTAAQQWRKIRDSGVRVINVSPIRDDVAEFVGAEWWPCRPNSDVAIMLGLAHTLYKEGLHDQEFIDRYCEGFDHFVDYLMGTANGACRDAEWAERVSGVSAEKIRAMAKSLANDRSLLGISWSLQRQEHGEQPYWMITVLAAMLGQIGLPGGGVAYGYGCIHNAGFGGRKQPEFPFAALPQGHRPIDSSIPVARISDMLLAPGSAINYNGKTVVYPDIRLIYWAGGNPFHHHQDLNRLRRAWSKPETVIVNEIFWTSTARHADIVFPCNTSLERNDLGGSGNDVFLTPMRQAVLPFKQSRSDYQIFSGLAQQLGFERQFTESRTEMEWVEHLYTQTRANAKMKGVSLPSFQEFWRGEQLSLEEQLEKRTFTLENFRRDPAGHPLATQSGKIEIFSSTIDGFNYEDCQGHPRWYEKQEWEGAGRYPLHLISNQPRTRLHSQYNHARLSAESKLHGREVVRMNADDATRLNICSGDIVRIYNHRGACLATAQLSENIAQGVVELPTGAWYEALNPHEPNSLEINGNPNVLTRDQGTSNLAQGPTAHSCLVDVEVYEGSVPPSQVFTGSHAS